MDWLISNPIASLSGPVFLLGYALVLLVLLFFVHWYRHVLDKSDQLGPMLVAPDPDPYRLAYFRGGLQEVLRLYTVDLYERGVLKEKNDRPFRRSLVLVEDADLKELSPSMRSVAYFYGRPRQPKDILRWHETHEIEKLTEEWDTWIDQEQLRFSAEQKAEYAAITSAAAAFFLLLGLYKILVALVQGHDNIWVLVVMTVLGSMGIVAGLPKRTSRGRTYIEDLQTVFSSLKKLALNTEVVKQSMDASSTCANCAYALPVMAMGLFGMSALQGGRYKYLHSQYAPASGCGAGCGSAASCGGGGCGGGCGGCGGGCGG